MNKEVNSTSLEDLLNAATATVKTVYTIIEPDGSSDDVQYTSYQKACKALLEFDDIKDKCREEALKELGGRPHQEDIDDFMWTNCDEIAQELGYRLNPIVKGGV